MRAFCSEARTNSKETAYSRVFQVDPLLDQVVSPAVVATDVLGNCDKDGHSLGE